MQTQPSNRTVKTWSLVGYVVATSIALFALYKMRPDQVNEAARGFGLGFAGLCLLAWIDAERNYGKRIRELESEYRWRGNMMANKDKDLKEQAENLAKLKEERYQLAQEKEKLQQELKIHKDDLEGIKEDYSGVVRDLQSAHKQIKLRGEMMAERDKELRRVWLLYASQKRAADYWRKKFHNPKTRYHAKAKRDHQGQGSRLL